MIFKNQRNLIKQDQDLVEKEKIYKTIVFKWLNCYNYKLFILIISILAPWIMKEGKKYYKEIL